MRETIYADHVAELTFQFQSCKILWEVMYPMMTTLKIGFVN